ncbi:hypothetical protein HZB03_01475 [Candidatus Woesearchaeota archaeon]|nr:hypothetical protein [Candidatus Woesearchaeota archaeon]
MISRRYVAKKAQISMGVKPIIGGILAFMVIVATIGLFMGLMRIFSPKANEGTVKGFSNIVEGAEALYSAKNTGSEEVNSCYILNAYTEPNFAIVGFNEDGVKSLTENKVCKHGGFCIEEHCGAIDDDVDKPVKCGSGPCVCLCDAGKLGDLDGEDCDKGNAKCSKLRVTGLSQFSLLSTVTGTPKADLVMYGESCIVGSALKVRPGIVLRKNGNLLEVIESSDAEYVKKFPGAVPCRDLARKFKEPPKPKSEAPPQTVPLQQGPSLDQQLTKAGAEQKVTSKPVG